MLALLIGEDAAIDLIDAAEPRLEEPTDIVRFALADIVDGFELFEARGDGVIKVAVTV